MLPNSTPDVFAYCQLEPPGVDCYREKIETPYVVSYRAP
jgi:hypothetical protein